MADGFLDDLNYWGPENNNPVNKFNAPQKPDVLQNSSEKEKKVYGPVEFKQGRLLVRKIRCQLCASPDGRIERKTRAGFSVWKCKICHQTIEIEYI